jgi:hypothetical protein
MPMPKRYLDELGAKHKAAEQEARRASRSDILRTLRDIFFWTAVGLVVLAFAFHVNDRQLGVGLLWAGQGIGFGGVAFSLLAAYRRGEKRGDW